MTTLILLVGMVGMFALGLVVGWVIAMRKAIAALDELIAEVKLL